MVLQACVGCKFGSENDGNSYCNREAVYSYLTNCVRQKAIDYYLVHTAVSEVEVVGMVGNQ